MSSNVTLNGVQYVVPAYNDTGWAQGAGNLSLYLAAIASSTLQPTGGSFTLTADVDFGANFGLKALFLKTETANPASAGVIRLASADTIKWRNNANGADVSLSKDSSDNLLWATNKVYTAGGAAGIVNADIAAGAAIAYSKLALTGAILNADLAGSITYSKLILTGAVLNADLAGSIAYSKLVLAGSVVNGDLTAGTILNTAINASAAIALSKLAALGTAKAVQTNASTGFLEASSVTNTELGYLSGVTSAIQTQFAATIANPLTADLAAAAHKITNLGNISFDAPGTKGIVGSDGTGAATAGNLGEVVSSTISSNTNFPATGAWGDLTSISLTAGQWDVSVQADINNASGVTVTEVDFGWSITTGNSSTGLVINENWCSSTVSVANGLRFPYSLRPFTLRVSATTTVYLKMSAIYTGGTAPFARGNISAIRRR